MISDIKYYTILKELKDYYKTSIYFYYCSDLSTVLKNMGFEMKNNENTQSFIDRIVPQFEIFLANEIKRILPDNADEYKLKDPIPTFSMYINDEDYTKELNKTEMEIDDLDDKDFMTKLKKYKVFLLKREINRIKKIINK